MVGVGGIKAYFAFSIAIWLALCQYSSQISLPTDPTYNAGVVEFAAAAGSSSSEILKLNVRSMVSIIESEATKDLDILVFPEYVLNKKDWRTYVPDPELLIAPCDVPDYHQSLVDLSCAARSRKLYVVVNVAEKYKCAAAELESCNANGLHGYNTNVVFDRMGRVISRYRKTHLYGSEWYSSEVLSQPERAVFTTDFGVTFGHFICFDMLFYDPAEVLTQQMNVTDIIYPTYWFSELPFLTALQLQQGWAYANNVNLLAAGGSYPAGKNTGSGIFAGRHGRLAAAIFEESTTKLLTAKVPKRGFNYELPPQTLPIFEPQVESQRFTKLSLLRDYNVDIFATILLPQNFTSVTEKLCHNDFCCDFQVQRTLIQESSRHTAYSYRLAAYSGNQTTFQRKDQSDLSICAIIACTNDQLYSCGHIFPESVLVGNKYYFNSISISGGFRPAARRLIAPSTVDATMMPLPVAAWIMNEVERANVTEVTIKLNAPQEDLLTFGLWANYYSTVKNTHNLDRTSANIRIPTNNAAASLATGFSQHHVMILLSLCLLLTVFKFKF